MRATIDPSGRVVVPKAIRDRLNLRGGESFEIVERDGVLELRPVGAAMRLRHDPEGAVIEPLEDVPPLTDDLVRATAEELRP